MRRIFLILACALALPAGVIQGVALEWASGKPLSRTIVHLKPVPGSGGGVRPMQARSGRSGQFQFGSVPDGLYLLETQREGFLPAAYGQRRPTGYGMPIAVSRDTSIFAELRLHRMGAITGTVLDENGVGIPRVEVVAYRARLPLRIVSRGTTDDRGVYRISGLELGKHWVRTASHVLDDGAGLLPMFGPESREPRDATAHEVRFDNDTTDANIRPEPGTLSTLSGRIVCDRQSPVVVTLSSETIRKTTEAACGGTFSFNALAPAVYEIFLTYSDGSGSGFSELSISQNTQTSLQVITTQPVLFDVRDHLSRAPLRTPIALAGRRDELSGAEPFREITFPRALLAAGHWELTAAVGPSQYVASIQTDRGDARRPWRAVRSATGFPFYLEPWRGGDRIHVNVSERAAQVGGVVTTDGKKAPGIPVFLWPVKEETRRMVGGAKETLTDINGRYHFAGLPPGEYRVLATMDVREMSAEVGEESQAKSVNLSEGQSLEQGLSVWIAP
ncbi:MAG: hypothetical protein IT162_14030 [Bryobacterales bacterium]|nr:hypothetical protein [Bryobacterales bacterium]